MSPVIDGAEVTEEELAQARRYPMLIEWSEPDALFLASFPDVPGIVTHGATAKEAAERGEEVIVIWLTSMSDAGYDVPLPTTTARHASVSRPPTYSTERITMVRRRLGVSQQVFADLLNVSVGTVRSWEQGVRKPDGASRRLLDIAERHPETLLATASFRPSRGAAD